MATTRIDRSRVIVEDGFNEKWFAVNKRMFSFRHTFFHLNMFKRKKGTES